MDKKISNFAQIGYIKRYTLCGGKEDGLNVLEVDNGNIRFTLNESKALDMMQLWHKGENISFISKNGFTKRELPFLNRFEGGMLYTVGLDSAGGREGYEMHGTFHNIPAKVVSTILSEDKIEIVGEIEDTSLFGKNLKMVRKISTAVLSDSVEIEDTLINNGTKEEDYCLLYHCNLGYPFLDENIELSFDGEKIIPRNQLAKERLKEINGFLPPIDNQEERCYYIKNKEPKVVAVNTKQNKMFTLKYSIDTLPQMVLWQSNATNDYALGIEPTTTFLDDYFTYSKIGVSEQKVHKIQFIIEDI